MKREALIAAIRAAAAPKPREVTVPGLGTVFVRPLTVEQVDLQQQAKEDTDDDGKDRLRFARTFARTLCDAAGVLLFDPDNKEDVEMLAALPWGGMQEVLSAISGDSEKNA